MILIYRLAVDLELLAIDLKLLAAGLQLLAVRLKLLKPNASNFKQTVSNSKLTDCHYKPNISPVRRTVFQFWHTTLAYHLNFD